MHTLSLHHIAIVGGGKMGEAILAGLLRAQTGVAACVSPEHITVVNPGEERRAFLAHTYGVSCVAHVSEIEPATLVVLAVKPQVMPGVLENLASCAWVAESCVVSIAAGIATHTIEEALPAGAVVVRAMPNTPLTVGHGTVAVCAGSSAQAEDAEAVADLFKACGTALIVDEVHMDAVTAVSGSGPAYVAALIEAMAAAGAELGLPANVAEQLATTTVEGTAALLLQTGQGATKTRTDVCSPGGTTLAALDAMEKEGYTRSIMAGVHAAAQRSKELSQ